MTKSQISPETWQIVFPAARSAPFGKSRKLYKKDTRLRGYDSNLSFLRTQESKDFKSKYSRFHQGQLCCSEITKGQSFNDLFKKAMKPEFDAIIVGAGAAGMMCAALAGQRGRKVLLLDHAEKPGKKILISGGGRCNFTNIYSNPENFHSANPHFCKSALSRYTPQDFIKLVNNYHIAWHEKKDGQLFCDGASGQIVNLLLSECRKGGVDVHLNKKVTHIKKNDLFKIQIAGESEPLLAQKLVIATGGLSIPKMGASAFGYETARHFGLKIIEPRPALVPFKFSQLEQNIFKGLAGVSLPVTVSCNKIQFTENLLFTHQGISGPAILQISSYWRKGDEIVIDFLPGICIEDFLQKTRESRSRSKLKTILSEVLPQRFVSSFCNTFIADKKISQLNKTDIKKIGDILKRFNFKPADTLGFKKAEVTAGGVDTNELSSKSLEAKKVPGLYFIGEVVDVTGQLGGHNFQWAWASAFATAQNL